MSILDLFRTTPDLGANFDTRPEKVQKEDTQFSELVSSSGVEPVNWVEKHPSDYRRFPIFDQNGSGSCVAQTGAKLLGINYFINEGNYVHFSATHIYQRRSNKPSGGMIGVEGLRLSGQATTLEDLAPSQNLTDYQMDNYKIADYKKKVGEVFSIDAEPVIVAPRDIDTIASIIQKTGKGVMVWFYFKSNEWKREVPVVKYNDLVLSASTTARHSVTAVDFTIYKGEKALIIEDSWGPDTGNGGQRIITESFFNKRNWFCGYLMNFKFAKEGDVNKPKYTFNLNLKFEQTNDDIVALQDILKYEGLFPTNVGSTGYYGSITAKAVLAFQKKYRVASDTELDSLKGMSVGPLTREALNQIYG